MFQLYIEFLREFISFRSISSMGAYRQDMYKTALWLSSRCNTQSMNSEVIEGFGNPIVYAEYIHNRNLPTCLIYGHYDVDVALERDGWLFDPYVLHEKEKRLIGRGVVDNKGQIAIHLMTVAQLIQEKSLGYNIKVLIEGDALLGSGSIEKFLSTYPDKLSADCCLFSDGSILGDTPLIEGGCRGGAQMTVTLKTAHHDLHADIYGGFVPNAGLELSKLLAGVAVNGSRIQIPYFYYDVDSIDTHLKVTNKNITSYQKRMMDDTGCKKFFGSDLHLQVGLMPTIEIVSINAGDTAVNKNTIPAKATAVINIKTVQSQNTDNIIKNVAQWFYKNTPEYANMQIEADYITQPSKIAINNKYIDSASKILEQVYDQNPCLHYLGGSVPIVGLLQKMGLAVLMIPLANDDCRIYGVNENFRIDLIQKGLLFSKQFLSK